MARGAQPPSFHCGLKWAHRSPGETHACPLGVIHRCSSIICCQQRNTTALRSNDAVSCPHTPRKLCQMQRHPCCLVTQQKIKHQWQWFDLPGTSEVCPCPCPDTRQRHCLCSRGAGRTASAARASSAGRHGPRATGHGDARCRGCGLGQLPATCWGPGGCSGPSTRGAGLVPTHPDALLPAAGDDAEPGLNPRDHRE